MGTENSKWFVSLPVQNEKEFDSTESNVSVFGCK